MRQYSIRNLPQSLSKDGMGKVFPCLIQIPDAIELGIGAMPEPLYLGKDVPYPMVHLPSPHHFSQCSFKTEALTIKKSLKSFHYSTILQVIP